MRAGNIFCVFWHVHVNIVIVSLPIKRSYAIHRWSMIHSATSYRRPSNLYTEQAQIANRHHFSFNSFSPVTTVNYTRSTKAQRSTFDIFRKAGRLYLMFGMLSFWYKLLDKQMKSVRMSLALEVRYNSLIATCYLFV